ncbi:L-tyrosine/L-tryptophan isonitrile synthase family protein [Aliikangiella coralliicola]|uniref:Pyoverdine biosynthesis protein n=1 Tax=Aliikangiella coralliicola TaxID=2592383 RepID=A0A545U957_9GAMM|nr:isocyanide synthase family protein [Aliikangiella coralliicola]TQV85995.1 pyoverdine biosynthesis protein [Aliikangiella coralliicola]
MNSKLTTAEKLQPAYEIATRIIELIFARRRLLKEQEDVEFAKQIAPHIDKVINYVEQNKPIEMILPAFPGKSPNRSKTLSHLPDYGEFSAMRNLVELCREIEAIYEPGAKIIICSDGRVFADIIYVPDEHISEYAKGIRAYAEKHLSEHISFYNLEDVYDRFEDYSSLREELMISYGEPLTSLRKRIKEQREASTMYKGITKFMFEDYQGVEEFSNHSRTAIQRKARVAAYRVIQRSNAWGRLLKKEFPNSLRLSIHPQYLVSEKIGISMIGENDVWTTPWHSVVVKDKGKESLLPRAEAEKLDCALVYIDGQPSYFERLPGRIS